MLKSWPRSFNDVDVVSHAFFQQLHPAGSYIILAAAGCHRSVTHTAHDAAKDAPPKHVGDRNPAPGDRFIPIFSITRRERILTGTVIETIWGI
jgi:hypothetical protein